MTTQTLHLGDARELTRGEQLRNTLRRRTEWRGLILLAIVVAIAAVLEPLVFSAYAVTLSRIALVGLVALGLTVVVLMGELDLSVAGTAAVAGVIMARTSNLELGILYAVVAGVVIGIVNAFFVVKIGINSFIATLGMLFVLEGLSVVLSHNGQPIALTNVTASVNFGMPLIGPLTPRVVIFIVAFVVLGFFLARTRVGRELYAVGGNRQAARDAGLPVARRLLFGFILCAVFAASAGVINTLELGAADPTADSTILLSSIASAIIGGVALTGGRGSVFGTLIGAASLGILEVGLTLTGVSVDIQQIYIGGVLLLAIITDPASLRAASSSVRMLLRGARAHSDSRDLDPPTPVVTP